MIWLKRNIFGILDILKFLGIILLVFMFIHFNTAVAHQAQETQAIATSTNRVVKSQGDILKAIKQVTVDTQLTAQQQTAIIICMLQVPVQSRTTNLQSQCRNQATSVVPAKPVASAATGLQQSSKVEASSSPSQPAPNPNKAQADNSQAKPAPKPSVIQQVLNIPSAILKKL